MQRFLLLFYSLFLFTSVFAQEPLPKQMTLQEKLIWDDYLKNYPQNRGTNPPVEIPRTPSEWEEAQGVVMVWTQFESNLREIVRYAREHVTVYIVCNNAQTVKNYLTQGDVNLDNIEFIVGAFNSVWVRDFGPQSIYLAGTNELAFVDWVYNRPRPQDDQIPEVVGSFMDIPVYQMTQSPNRLVATGGNFMADGFDQGFSSKLILTENSSLTEEQIDNIKYSYMGIEPYIKMTTLPYDGIHHIDMHMKLLDEETLLVGQYPEGIADGPYIEANLNYILDNFETPYGRPFNVVRIPMPSNSNGQYPDTYSHYYTYANSLILNELVLVPQYNLPEDEEALEVYRQAMPGYRVVGLDMRNVVPSGGVIHCITREIAANDPILISHATYRENLPYSADGYTINASIESAQSISNAEVYWSIDTTAGFTSSPLQLIENNNYTTAIPQLPIDTKVYYYISATNENGKTITKPLVAPQGLYHFNISDAHTVTIAIEGDGNTTPTPGDYEFDTGYSLTITATPNQGWVFEHWQINDEIYTSSQLDIIIDKNITATALFTEDNTSITALDIEQFTLYPNPANNTLWIKGLSKYENQIFIYNTSGTLVHKALTSGVDEKQIDVSLLPSGVYMVSIQGEHGVWSSKFVKL